jgi:hypothetical protein
LHSAQLLFSLPWGQGLHATQLPLNFPWGQGLHSAHLRFTLPWGQGLHAAQFSFRLPCGHPVHSTQFFFSLPCAHRFSPMAHHVRFRRTNPRVPLSRHANRPRVVRPAGRHLGAFRWSWVDRPRFAIFGVSERTQAASTPLFSTKRFTTIGAGGACCVLRWTRATR